MKIKIGTRKSRLALVQTELAAKAIVNAFPNIETELVHISTKGDKILDKPLGEIGGKGVFVSEIERALQSGEIDIAVHSAKDLPIRLADGLEISAVLKRGDYRDVIVTNSGVPVRNERDFTVGTGSLRRRIGVGAIYPRVTFKDIRGNVDTRLNKLFNREYSAVVLAAAGLERLGLFNDSRFDFRIFNCEEILPSPCQGIIAIESRKNDFVTPILERVNDGKTFTVFETERSVLRLLNADCGMPVGAYACAENGGISLSVSKDGINTVSGEDDIPNRFELAKELISKL